MAEFASKGVAGSGLGLGIAGTALGLLNNGGNGGLLGGLFGGGFGQTDHVVSLKGLCGDDQYVFLKSVNVICGVDNEGNGVMACLVPDATGKIKSNALKFRTINMDGSSATKTRSFKVYITVTAEISNTNFSLGQLFPTTK